ncbi:MAG: 3-isopropylmalate dehydrogenase [Actinomycetaceae bacterium]|nr:3-isopropylmalate dehydrogenase [Actinomycetaceae bacterium]
MSSQSQKLNLAIIPGDGIGEEIVEQGVRVLDHVLGHALSGAVTTDKTYFNLGAKRYHETGDVLPDDEFEQLKTFDAILLGAVGDPSVESGILERGILLKLRFGFDHYVNLRPSKYYPGVKSPLKNPDGIDFVVVREGTEGLYCGNGGSFRYGTPHEIANEVSINTAFGIERVMRFAFQQAMKRRKKLTLVHKHNVLVHAGHLYRRTMERLNREEFPEVTCDYAHVDAATIYLVQDPQRYDVIVTDNLFGDILTDEAGAVTGGIGLSASGNINPEGAFPSIFEPVHGSAPDIAGKGIADPTATILSVAMMLEHLELPDAAQAIYDAVERDMAARAKDPGLAKRSTEQIGQAICDLIA